MFIFRSLFLLSFLQFIDINTFFKNWICVWNYIISKHNWLFYTICKKVNFLMHFLKHKHCMFSAWFFFLIYKLDWCFLFATISPFFFQSWTFRAFRLDTFGFPKVNQSLFLLIIQKKVSVWKTLKWTLVWDQDLLSDPFFKVGSVHFQLDWALFLNRFCARSGTTVPKRPS